MSMKSYAIEPFVSVSFTQHYILQVHPGLGTGEHFTLFYGWMIFLCVATSHFVYPSIG